jgi:hypothetical protein
MYYWLDDGKKFITLKFFVMNELIQCTCDPYPYKYITLVMSVLHQMFQLWRQMDNKTPTNPEMFNPLIIILFCHQKMGIPSGEPSFHPIVKFSSEEKLQNTRNWCNIKELNMMWKNLLPFKLYMKAALETKSQNLILHNNTRWTTFEFARKSTKMTSTKLDYETSW